MQHQPSIFVSIACFMDPDVIETVHSLFANASRPEAVSVGICLQTEPEDGRFEALKELPRVTIDHIPASTAKGPIYARYRCEQLLQDESHFLQIDCHTRFFPHWDQILLDEFRASQLLRNKVVLSHYPISITNMKAPEQLGQIGAINRFRHIGADAIKMHGTMIKIPERPQPAFGISAAMLFMSSQTKRDIPFDPDLHFGLHAAEQFLYSARLWTHGYQVMTPTRHSIATEYITNRERIPLANRKHYNQQSALWTDHTWCKVKYLLELDTLEQVPGEYRANIALCKQRYGMGRKRFLVDFYRHIGLHSQLLALFPHYREQYGHISG